MAFISFCNKMWKQQGFFDVKNGYSFNPYAAYRFLIDDCGLKCKHDIKIYGNFLRREWRLRLDGKRVKGNKDVEVVDWFSNME